MYLYSCISGKLRQLIRFQSSNLFLNYVVLNWISNHRECHLFTTLQVQKNGPFWCTICVQTFQHKQTWLAHMNRHKGIFRFTCKICGNGYSSSNALRGHVAKVWYNIVSRLDLYTLTLLQYLHKRPYTFSNNCLSSLISMNTNIFIVSF